MSPLPAPTTRVFTAVSLLTGAGVLLYLAALLWVGSHSFFDAAARLGPVAFVAGTLVASIAYAIRYLRFRLLLGWLRHRVPWGEGLRIYLAGLALTSTPGKLGETIRSLFLLRHGVPLSHSLAAFFADRLSDVLGVALLGAAAAAYSGERIAALEVLALVVLALSLLLRAAPVERIAARAQGVRRIGPWIASAASPWAAWQPLWRWSRFAPCVALALFAYGLQGLVFATYAQALGTTLSWHAGIAIFAFATLLGAASMIPAGLGVMEAALVAQLTLAGAAIETAIAVAVLTRASTLWCGLLVGATAMLGLRPLESTATDGGRVSPS